MRKLKLQMQVTLDGFNSTGPNDEQQWVTWDLEGIRSHIRELLDSSNTILIGRKLATDYIPYWQQTFEKPADPMHDLATGIVAAKKVVFSRTLKAADPSWKNTVVASGELREEVQRLKEQSGKDLIVYGGSEFVASLIQHRLVDEFHFFLNPISLGKGEGAFQAIQEWQPLRLTRSVAFPSGIVLLSYVQR